MKTKIIAVLIAMIAVGIASPLIKLAGAPPIVTSTYRMTLSALMVLPVFIIFGFKGLKKYSRNEILALTLPALLLAVHFILWITSLSYTSVLSSTILVTTNPIFVPIFSYLLFKERTKKTLILGIVVAFSGSVLIALSSQGKFTGSNLGNALAILGAMAVSLYLIITRRFRAKFSLIVYIFFVYSFSSIFLILFSILTRQKLFGYSKVTYVYLFLVALLPQIIGHTLYNWALKYFSAPFIAVSILGEPVFASLFAFMLLNERPSLIEVVGAIIIMVGIYLSQRAESLSRT